MLITIKNMMAAETDGLSERAAQLSMEDIEKLVEWLSLKEDDIRYQAFLLLQARSRLDSDVYPYWDVFRTKLSSDNSYQRSLGIMLIAENVQWDVEHKMKETLPELLDILQDEKPITVRQYIQSLGLIVRKETGYNRDIADALLAYDMISVRESMRKLILTDIIYTLVEIRKSLDIEEINAYILVALSGEILDGKTKKAIEKLFLQ